jgi:hypothetical protein
MHKCKQGESQMNSKALGLLGLGLAASIANAGAETLNYAGSVMSVVSASGYAPPAPFAMIGSITLSSPLGANLTDAVITPTAWAFNTPLGELSSAFAATQPYDSGAIFEISTVHGAITSWSIDLFGGITEGTNSPSAESAVLQSSGDSYTGYFSSPSCAAPPGVPTPCFQLSLANNKAGVWTTVNAPELNGASAAAALTLLLGSVAVLCGRGRQTRRREPDLIEC